MKTINILAPETAPGRLPFKLEGEIEDGQYKALQEWVLSFLTLKGSVLVLPNYGTDFTYYLESGLIRSTADVQQYFSEASAQALEDIETDTTTDNRVHRAVLMNYSVGEDGDERVLLLDVGFEFTDGSSTRANLGVN
jgi:hypothetical protein